MYFASLEINMDLRPYKIYVLIFHEIVFIYRILPGHATLLKLFSKMVFVFIETVKTRSWESDALTQRVLILFLRCT